MTQIDKLRVIRDHLSEEDILCQLAEEAAEGSQAALKLRRAITRTNPMPTDAVPVIRCRDCKFASHRAANVYPVVECRRPDVGYGAVRKLDDYCSYGERKEDDNAD